MRTTLLALLAVIAAAVSSGCGSDDLTAVTPAEAAAGTREAETARTAMVMRMSGLGLPKPLTIKADGVSATDAPRLDMVMDFGPLLESFGAGGDGKTRFVVDGERILVDPPAIPGIELPGGAQWVTADLGEVLKSMNIDAGGFGELMRLSTDQQLAAIQAAGSIKEVGEEEIDGARTTHLRGTVKVSDYIGALPAERRERARKAIRELERLPGGDDASASLDAPAPTDMWIDEDKRLRRMTQVVSLPAQEGLPGGRMTITMNLKDFGTKLELPAPRGDDVYDATADLAKVLKQAR
jgi:hypothetical protein